MIFLYYSYLVRNISVTTVASFAETRCCRLALYCGKNTVDWIRCLKEVDCTVVAGRQQWLFVAHDPPDADARIAHAHRELQRLSHL